MWWRWCGSWAGWSWRYRVRVDSWRLPASRAKRAELAAAYGTDGFALLAAVYAPDAPAWLAQLPAVDVLRQVLVQNYTRTIVDGQEVIKRREADIDGLPPGRRRLSSPYDTDARWGVKRDTYWHGYKVHVSETCDTPDTGGVDAGEAGPAGQASGPPNLITNVATTDATVSDSAMTEPIHRQLAARGLLPAQPARHRHRRDHVRDHHLRAVPRPGPVHHLETAAPPAHRAPPRGPRRPSRRPRPAEHPGLAGEVRATRRSRRDHPPRRRRHRPTTRPLPRPRQNPPRTHLLSRRPQPDPPARLLERPSARPTPNQPPRPPGTSPGRLNPISQQDHRRPWWLIPGYAAGVVP